MHVRLRRRKGKWAKSFHNKIQSHVYHQGSEDGPQTWPLVRKVILHGPWACLSTGACLVDLPGVRDANAARAKVSENYIKKCNKIWVVAPIKRAVDDGTAKELLGEQFKRRLLMDGQYGNVSFICTQTDDCEVTEIIRDHADVAKHEKGRWEKISHLSQKICEMEKRIGHQKEKEEDYKADVYQKEEEESFTHAYYKFEAWKGKNNDKIMTMQYDCQSLQSELKLICATVRNEYSKKRLQEDFKEGLRALYSTNHGDDDDDDEEEENPSKDSPKVTAIPKDFVIDVYCISANDYLKIQKIKSLSDGMPATFKRAEDTQIPHLQKFVHDLTICSRSAFAKSFVNSISDIMERMKLVAVNSKIIVKYNSSSRYKQIFEEELEKIEEMIQAVAEHFEETMDAMINHSLRPVLMNGANKSIAAGIPISKSWGSKTLRTKIHRDINNNGMHYSSYLASVRRKGVYNSAAVGLIDMNQELCDPMEKEFSVDWQRIMDNALLQLLDECKKSVHKVCSEVNNSILNTLEKEGMDIARVVDLSRVAGLRCFHAVEKEFEEICSYTTQEQKNLNRSLLSFVQSQMDDCYEHLLNVPSGKGRFNRMKHVMETTTASKIKDLFEESSMTILKGIYSVVKRNIYMISKTGALIAKRLNDVYSLCWNDLIIPSESVAQKIERKVKSSGDSLLPNLDLLFLDLRKIQDRLGIQHDTVDLGVTTVETSEDVIQKKTIKTKKMMDVIDLCDSDNDEEEDQSLSYCSKHPIIKPECCLSEEPKCCLLDV